MEQTSKCLPIEFEDNRTLSEIAHSRNRSFRDLLSQMKHEKSSLRERANEFAKERSEEKRKKQAEYEQRLKKYEEELAYQIMDSIFQEQDVDEIAERMAGDELRRELMRRVGELKYQPDELSHQDLERSLEEYIERGELKLEEGEIKITPKGARKLTNQILARILNNLADRQLGSHTMEEIGYGVERSPRSRKYELGDEYDKIDFEKTFLNALERKTKTQAKIKLEPEDFQVYEEIHQTKMVAGLIIDESGSMSGDKTNAAIDTSLALAELIRREPKDLLKVYLFSHQVREIPYYEILNASFSGGSTDIRAALRAFREGISNEQGDKQAYLITDTEPNTEDGRYVGFNKAASGVVQEALYCRRAGITLNIIMLDQSPRLKELASILAKRSLGRVFFTSPSKLGEVVIEDYLIHKKESVRSYK